MGIGKTLSDIMRERNENPNSLAEKIGVSPSTIYSITKRDNMKVDISVLARICKVLNVPMERFYNEYINSKEQQTFSADDKILIEKFRSLDCYGKRAVMVLLDVEYERCTKTEIKIAARNGEYKTLTVTSDEAEKILEQINQMTDVEE